MAGRSPDRTGSKRETGKSSVFLSKLIQIGIITLLFGGSFWLISNSPFPKKNFFIDASTTLLGGGVLTIYLLSAFSFLWSIRSWRKTRQIPALALALRKSDDERIARETGIINRSLARLAVLGAIAGTTLLFSASLFLIANTEIDHPAMDSDWGGVLFAAASLALLVFAILIAIATVVGWPGLKNHIKKRVAKAIEPLREELKGRSSSNSGYLLGELSLYKGKFEVENSELLEDAIGACEKGFRLLQNAEPGPRLMAINNWLYYMTFKREPLRDPEILRLAIELERVGNKERVPRLLLTYCRVIACYSTDLTERSKAESILRSLLSGGSRILISGSSMFEEAKDCLKLFSDRRLPYR